MNTIQSVLFYISVCLIFGALICLFSLIYEVRKELKKEIQKLRQKIKKLENKNEVPEFPADKVGFKQ